MMRGQPLDDNQGPFLKWLPFLRAAAGYSQAGFADRCGMSQSRISYYENHYVKPHYLTMKKMADVLRCKVPDLYSEEADHRN